jgi:hypothetical protein
MKTETSSLFCFRCGAEGQTTNAYCKRCGEWLPAVKTRSPMAFGGQTPQQNIFTSLFMSALSAAVALFSAIALYATYLGTPEAKWSIYIAAAFCLCISGWQITSFMAAVKLRRRLGKGRETVAAQVDLKKEKPVLGPGDLNPFADVTSVTERTTNLLEPVGRAKTDASGETL